LTVYVDVSSIREIGGIRRAWIKMEFSNHTQRGFTDKTKWLKEALYKLSVNCAEETYLDGMVTEYYEDGRNNSFNGGDKWIDIVPETLVSSEARLICEFKL